MFLELLSCLNHCKKLKFSRKIRKQVFFFVAFVLVFEAVHSKKQIFRRTAQHECGSSGVTRLDCESTGSVVSTVVRSSTAVKANTGGSIVNFDSSFRKTCSAAKREAPPDCSLPGISRQECHSRHCCYDQRGRCLFPGITAPIAADTDRPAHCPFFIVVVFCRGRGALHVSRALWSVVLQTFSSWELIIHLDEASDESCISEAEDFMLKHGLSRGRSSFHETSRCEPTLDHKKARFVLPLQAHDHLHPDFLLESFNLWQQNNKVQLIYGDREFAGKPRVWSSPASWTGWFYPKLELAKLPSSSVTFTHDVNLIKHETGDALDYGSYDFWLTLIKTNPVLAKIKGISSWYYPGDSSIGDKHKELASYVLDLHQGLLRDSIDACLATGHTFCRIGKVSHGTHLRHIIELQVGSCLGWLWMALYKLRQNCVNEARALLLAGLHRCGLRIGSREGHVSPEKMLFFHLLHWIDTGAAALHELIVLRERCQSYQECNQCAEYFVESTSCGTYPRYSTAKYIGHDSETQNMQDFSGDPIVDKLSHFAENMDLVLSSGRREIKPSMVARKTAHSKREDIPNQFHFVYGLKSGQVDFELIHYLSIRSAIEVNPGAPVFIHVFSVPKGTWWDNIKNHVQIIIHPSFHEYSGRCIVHHSHKADILRLQVLHDMGGIYLDIDTISLRPWSHHLSNAEFIMAWQNSPSAGTAREGKIYGLCNAAMASSKQSIFSKIWLESYKFFRSNGQDEVWDEHSVILPANISEKYDWIVEGNFLTTLKSESMWNPLWGTVAEETLNHTDDRDLQKLYPEALLIHLWRGGDRKDELNNLEQSCGWLLTTPLGRTAKKYVFCDKSTGKIFPVAW